MKKIALVAEMHHVKKILKRATADYEIVALRPEIGKALEEAKVSHKTTDDYNFNRERIEQDSISWMKEFPGLMSLDGKTLKEALSLDDFSVWWLMENWLFYSSVYMDSLKQVLETTSYISGILRHEKPDDVLFVDDGMVASEIIKRGTQALGIKTASIHQSIFKRAYNTKRLLRKIAIKYFIDIGFSFRRARWNLLRRFSKIEYKRLQGNKRIVLISTHGWGVVRDDRTGKNIQENPDISPLIEELDGRGNNVLSIGIQVGNFLDMGQMKQLALARNYRILESYYNKDVKKMVTLWSRELKKKWELIRKLDGLDEKIVYNGIPIWRLIEPQTSCYFSTRLKGHLRDFFLLNEMLSVEKPSLVVYPAETSEFGRSMFYNCKKKRIPSIGIQHGIFDKNLACIHDKSEISLEKTGPEVCPIPDITAVYGQFYKDILVRKGNYPPRSVVVTGGQRFDRIINEKYDRDSLCDKLGIDKHKKIIAYITSPVPENEFLARAVFNAVKPLSNIALIVKIHPSEKDTLYKKVAVETGSDVVVVSKTDLYEVLNACEIMITYLSTSGLEVMMLGKPVVVLNLSGKPDAVSYAIEGAAIGVYDEAQLGTILSELLYNDSKSKKAAERSEECIKKFIYKNDGNATKRIAKIIEDMAGL